MVWPAARATRAPQQRPGPDVARTLPAQPLCEDVLLEKYAKGSERTVDDINQRVAQALAAQEAPAQRRYWEARFLAALQSGFLPAGRIQSTAGTDLAATLINCFVQPVGDSILLEESGYPGIYTALAQAAETMRRGGGVGFDFSRIRPRGALVSSTRSSASGPISYMRVFDRSCETVESAGARRGAQMGVLRCDHPDIEAFIHAKDAGDLKNFNLSVGVTDDFMGLVETDGMVELVHSACPGPAQMDAGAYRQEPTAAMPGPHEADAPVWVYQRRRARELWDQIMRSTYDHAEPGVLFLDQIHRDNNLAYCETIASTNPCAEQPLPPFGCCCLGSIDLTRFVQFPFTPRACFDRAGFAEVAKVAVRMLDNVLDASVWPLPQQQQEAQSKRRIGLGFTGLGDALIMLNLPYNSDAARALAGNIAQLMRDSAYEASIALALERGAFPRFDAERYLASPGFASRLPEVLKDRIRTHGLRNSHLLSIAPAGTISLAFADNASNGIEPAFNWRHVRNKRMADGSVKAYVVENHAWRLYRYFFGAEKTLTPAFVTALEMSAQDQVAMVAAVAPFIDSSISKTVNVSANCPFAEFKNLYLDAWKSGLKGLATYRPNAVLGAVLGAVLNTSPSTAPVSGAVCPACGNGTVIPRDGCDFCTACNFRTACNFAGCELHHNVRVRHHSCVF